MLKQTINYEDFAGQKKQTIARFNISPREVRELNIPEMLRQAETVNREFQATINDSQQDQESIEFKSKVNDLVSQFLDIIEGIIDISYGVLVDDDRFVKGPEYLASFKQSAAFESFLLSFANEPDVAKNFIEGLVPQGSITAGVETPVQRIQPRDHLPSARETFKQRTQPQQGVIDVNTAGGLSKDDLSEFQQFQQWKAHQAGQ